MWVSNLDCFSAGWAWDTHVAAVSQPSEGSAEAGGPVSAAHWLGHFGSHLVCHFPADKTGLLHGMMASGAK